MSVRSKTLAQADAWYAAEAIARQAAVAAADAARKAAAAAGAAAAAKEDSIRAEADAAAKRAEAKISPWLVAGVAGVGLVLLTLWRRS